MAWEEWEQLKTAAAEQHGTGMQLNQVPTDPGGTLVSNRPVWSKAGRDVGSLGNDLGKAKGKLADGQQGLGQDDGCLTAGAQRVVHASWEKYIENVGNRCEKLAGLFQKAGNDQLKTDESIQAEIGNLRVSYDDTPAVGGKG
jgi:hypothetical protein